MHRIVCALDDEGTVHPRLHVHAGAEVAVIRNEFRRARWKHVTVSFAPHDRVLSEEGDPIHPIVDDKTVPVDRVHLVARVTKST